MTTPSAAGTGETFVEMTRRLYNGNELVPEPWALIEATQRAVAQRCAELCREKAADEQRRCDALEREGHQEAADECQISSNTLHEAAAAILAWQKEGK